MSYRVIQPCYKIINKETQQQYLLTSKALEILKNAPSFETKYEIVEGQFIYARDGSIVRVDAPKKTAQIQEKQEDTIESVEAKRQERKNKTLQVQVNSLYTTESKNEG